MHSPLLVANTSSQWPNALLLPPPGQVEDDIAVQRFRGRWQVSTAGGTRPAWARNGNELFFLDRSNTFTSVLVRTSGTTFIYGSPSKVFDAKYMEPNPARHYDVSLDGNRFLMIKNSADGDPTAAPPSIVVVQDWFDELKQRVH